MCAGPLHSHRLKGSCDWTVRVACQKEKERSEAQYPEEGRSNLDVAKSASMCRPSLSRGSARANGATIGGASPSHIIGLFVFMAFSGIASIWRNVGMSGD